MFSETEYQEKLSDVLRQPYMVDRLGGIKVLEEDIAARLKKHDKNKHGTAGVQTMFIGFGVVAVAVTGIILTGGSGMAAAFVGVVGSGFSVLAGMVASETDGAKKASEEKYNKTNGYEIKALKEFDKQIKNALRSQFDAFLGMPAAQQAGLLKLEDMAETFPEIRNMLVSAFKRSVEDPLLEQGQFLSKSCGSKPKPPEVRVIKEGEGPKPV